MAQHLLPHDVVPTLRNDLNLSAPPTGTGAEVIRVGPADSNARMSMHGFEFSIARMLNGKRTVEDVMVNCARLGLPVSREALDGFLEQLQSHGLIAGGPGAQTRTAPSAWAHRQEWTPQVRDLYRAALRSAREGQLDDALRIVTQLKSIAPQIPEAERLHEWLENHRSAPRGEFQKLFHQVEQSWLSHAEPYVEPARKRTRSLEADFRVGRSLWPFAAVGAAIVLLAAAMFIPLPRRFTASVQLSPITSTPVEAAAPGLIDQLAVQEGQYVTAGTPLFTYFGADLEARLADAQSRLEEARTATPVMESSTGVPLSAEAIAPRDEEAIAGLEHEVQQLQTLIANPTVTASHNGVVKNLFLQPGGAITQGQQVMQLDDVDRLKAVLTVTPRWAKVLSPGDAMTLDFGNARQSTIVDSISGFDVAAEVPNEGGSLLPGSKPVTIELKPASAVQRLR